MTYFILLYIVSSSGISKSTMILSSQRAKENAEKNGSLDYRDISHITIIGS